jgi:hypothetical protein
LGRSAFLGYSAACSIGATHGMALAARLSRWTCPHFGSMSALFLKADIHWRGWHIRFVPKAESIGLDQGHDA